MEFFCVFFWGFFFHYIVFGLSPSGLGYNGFVLFFDLGLLFPFYCLWFKSIGLGYDGFFLCFVIVAAFTRYRF